MYGLKKCSQFYKQLFAYSVWEIKKCSWFFKNIQYSKRIREFKKRVTSPSLVGGGTTLLKWMLRVRYRNSRPPASSMLSLVLRRRRKSNVRCFEWTFPTTDTRVRSPPSTFFISPFFSRKRAYSSRTW